MKINNVLREGSFLTWLDLSILQEWTNLETPKLFTGVPLAYFILPIIVLLQNKLVI